MAAKNLTADRCARFVEWIAYHFTIGRLRALREDRERRKPKPQPLPPAKPPKPQTFGDHMALVSAGTIEATQLQQEWEEKEFAANSSIAGSGPDDKAWLYERARRVAKLRLYHDRNRLQGLGIANDQLAAECGIPPEVAQTLRDQF